MATKIGQLKVNGLELGYRGTNNHTYVMKIWKNFHGYSFIEIGEDGKKISQDTKYFRVTSWDYPTAAVYLREHFGLEKI